MKLKILFLTICSLFSMSSFSQLKVKTDGTVKIGSFINGFNNTDNASVFQLLVDGNALNSGNWTVLNLSLQKDAIPIDGALDKLLKINGRTFTNSLCTGLNYGFNAQEIKNVLPNLVREVDSSSTSMAVNYDGFIPILVEALKEQQVRIDWLGKETVPSSMQTQKDNGQPKDIHFTVRINLGFPNNITSDSILADNDILYYDQAILKLPDTYSEIGTPTRLVYYAHGAGSSKKGMVTADSWVPAKGRLDDSLLANGYAIFDANGGPIGENMGGVWLVQSVYKAYEYIQQHYNVSKEIFVAGLSMGGLSSTNFVYKHSNIVLAHGMFCPVLDLYEQAWKNPWYSTTKEAIAVTYNFDDQSGNTWEHAKVDGWNPLLINTFYNGKDTFKIYPVPVKIWHSIEDKTVSISGSRNFHRYIRNSHGYSELREINKGGHELSTGNPNMIHEMILFFRRFDK